jgi:hypothetical protein
MELVGLVPLMVIVRHDGKGEPCCDANTRRQQPVSYIDVRPRLKSAAKIASLETVSAIFAAGHCGASAWDRMHQMEENHTRPQIPWGRVFLFRAVRLGFDTLIEPT